MLRMKCLSATLVVCAVICLIPAANAAVNVKFVAGGSSAMWQSMGIAANSLCGRLRPLDRERQNHGRQQLGPAQ